MATRNSLHTWILSRSVFCPISFIVSAQLSIRRRDNFAWAELREKMRRKTSLRPMHIELESAQRTQPLSMLSPLPLAIHAGRRRNAHDDSVIVSHAMRNTCAREWETRGLEKPRMRIADLVRNGQSLYRFCHSWARSQHVLMPLQRTVIYGSIT